MKLTVDRRRAAPLFVYYTFTSQEMLNYITSHAIQTGVPHTNLGILRDTLIVLPPLPEQHAIAHILGTLDDKIELNRRVNRTLEDLAHALFKSWFVDFDPVRAKAADRQPAGMDAETAALFPDGFEESEVGEIPRGWGTARLDEVIEVNPFRRLANGTIAPYLDMASMPTAGPRALEWFERPFGSGSKFVNGDVLLARITPCLENGKTAFVDFLMDGQAGWGSTEFIVMRSKPPLPSEWTYFWARSEEFRSYAIQTMTGSSGRQRVPTEAVARYVLPVPPEIIARCFGERIRDIFRAIKAHDEQSRTLSALRDTLLPRLLSGELRVHDCEDYS